jgi:hypothetical protein
MGTDRHRASTVGINGLLRNPGFFCQENYHSDYLSYQPIILVFSSYTDHCLADMPSSLETTKQF